jgi:ABC-type transport system involved in multi-copper enzyme maturation permease subunit
VTGFGRLLHAEWTKFRTVRGWLVGLAAAALAIIGLGLFPGVQGSCGTRGPESACVLPVGPEGEEVTDSFTFVHRQLSGDGSITVRVAELNGEPSLMPWAKAGLIVKDGTRPGSTYAAVLLTGGHGVRLQHDYVHDRPGSAARGARWLRLTRTRDTVTGAESADGREWTVIGSVRLPGLPATATAGLFVTSPQHAENLEGPLGASSVSGGPTRATATFDRLSVEGGWAAGDWTDAKVGGPRTSFGLQVGGVERTADAFTVSGSGDIAPSVAGAAGIGTSLTQTLVGTFAGLIVVVVLGAMFATSEYRRGLVRTTVAASPRRGRILLAKALVVGAASALTGLVAGAVVVTFGQRILRDNGAYVHPATTGTELRLIAGTAALLAVAGVLAMALGVLLRRGTPAVTVAVVTIVLPYLLAMSVLPATATQWLLRVTPAAAFAVQQSSRQYPQVDNLYTPPNGYFPLAPWAGFAVLAGWTTLALAAALFAFRRRDP